MSAQPVAVRSQWPDPGVRLSDDVHWEWDSGPAVAETPEPAQLISRGLPGHTAWVRTPSQPRGLLMANVSLTVNGTPHTVDVDPATPLLYVLRNDLNLQGPRFGCGLGQCGACTVIIDGAAVRSCVTPCSSVKSEVTTLEGLAAGGVLDPVQRAWIEEQVPQCGFCQNGQIMTATALLAKTPNPSDAQIREGMNQTLCR